LTVADLIFHASGRFPKPDLVGRATANGVTLTSGRELLERVRDISLGLSALGMQRGDRIAIIADSRPEWLFSDLAIVAAGAITTPIYPTLSAEQMLSILRDSEASLAIVSDRALLSRIERALVSTPSLRGVVLMAVGAGDTIAALGDVPVHALADVEAQGHRRILDGWGVAREFQEAAKRVKSDDPATLIYTSGTTGTPKGVLLTHGNLMSNVEGVCQVLDLHEGDTALSFLPLGHAFERIVSYVFLYTGVSVVFAESIETVARDLLSVRPTVMSGVPRMFEKVRQRMLDAGRAETGIKRRLFEWAVRLANRRGEILPFDRPLPVLVAWQSRLADRLVYRKLRDGIGGRLRFAVSGGAPLVPDVGRFFLGIGLPLLEGYGLTETSPVVCVMPPGRIRFGTVGPPLPNVELRIADDGEILARGPNVMSGYYKRPEESAAALADGWFHSGDLGSLDAEGYLHITGRKKELLVTSGGKKIAPHAIEGALKSHPIVEEAVVIAEKRNFVSALILPRWDKLCGGLGAPVPDTRAGREAFVARPDVVAKIQQVVDAVNASLARFECIKRFTILPDEFSVDGGELTPTLKVKRRVVEERYKDAIEKLYESPKS